ncbi:MAG: flagellar assembly protein FliH [Gammaproteobacteria bacterium]|nr:flagellar assembly protein FliH [Gammaproteobacteria bacterium]
MISSEQLNAEEIVPWVAPQLLEDESDTEEDDTKVDIAEHLMAVDAARQEGYTKGLEEGRAEVQDAGAREKAQLISLLQNLQRPLVEFENEVVTEVRRFALELARRVIKRELQSDEQFYLDLVQTLCSEYSLDADTAVVSLHAEDLELLRSHLPSPEESWVPRLVADNALERGSCLVDAGAFFIDAGIDTLMDKIISDLEHSPTDRTGQPIDQ